MISAAPGFSGCWSSVCIVSSDAAHTQLKKTVRVTFEKIANGIQQQFRQDFSMGLNDLLGKDAPSDKEIPTHPLIEGRRFEANDLEGD